MSGFRPKVISLNKKPGQTFGFYLRSEHGEEGHLIRCLEMGGPAELAGLKDGDRLLRVNGTFVDEMPHGEVVDMVTSSGTSVTFYVLDEDSYKQAKAQGVDLANPQKTPAENNKVGSAVPKAKLCYLVNSISGFGFSLSSTEGNPGMFIKLVVPGSVAHNAGLSNNDRLVELNGENIEGLSHSQVVEKIKKAGSSLMFLVVDAKTDEYYKNKSKTIGVWLASIKHLPHKPRVADLSKGPTGFGFSLIYEQNKGGHFIKDIEINSPAQSSGLKEMDRLVAVNSKEVDSWTHDQVVDLIRQSGQSCCFLVMDKFTDKMYKLGNMPPLLFLDTLNDSSLPPSYSEALYLPTHAQPSTPEPERREELKPKLCRMQKSSGSFGFHLNGIEGKDGHFLSEVVKDRAADVAGIKDGDILVEINGINVENRSHDEVVEMIHLSGNSLEMLVATKSVYNQLKANGVNITSQLLGECPEVQVQSTETNRDERQLQDNSNSRPETPTEAARERTSSSSSEDSLDEKL
ncbi:Na(+)/H(+) exchange regulatory cofactor NHE-RF3 [Takifugu rubripes]|uniref:PDZ domain containing 1 n=1 Tax=Takifugu rubripes TaxID=31033 RepID=H2SDP9_TAKRU|nr:Na(+)/H(+) exchange regulatory cofactor NHE-RF3 [Takifugu rubripes]XP_029703239.1 Na(+)/H(+) exchange regulatory cofactor NHE-RF3 [Takifugu rubripes]XP_029703243.1 Na(+)/H(+) exchange regulatory cofactor NHE-RF3 [Takifugu rubripes]